MRISALLFVASAALGLGAAGCYKPDYASNPDANLGFRCHQSDNPPCPTGLVCCIEGVCGDDISDPTLAGWCVPPPTPADLTVSPTSYWPTLTKMSFYAGDYMPDPLTGYDDQMLWRCTRDDTNPSPSAQILHMNEPNDFPDQAIVLSNPLPVDLPPAAMGAGYEICPDRTAPDAPDIDVYKFKLLSPAKVIAEIKYLVSKGDLDIGVFRLDTDPDTNLVKPTLIAKDVTAVDNGCVEIPTLAVGTYYVVVRGTRLIDQPGLTYTMNKYNLRVFTVDSGGYTCGAKKDGGV